MGDARPPRPRVRILVIGDDGVGKTSLVTALCGGGDACAPSLAHVSVRLSGPGGEAGAVVEELHDVRGGARFAHARAVLLRRPYDALVLVHDLCDANSRASLRRTWMPEAMRVLGDAAALSAAERGGRRHVRARGALNELGLLYRAVRSSYAGVSAAQALREGVRLCVQVVRLMLHETGLWVDERVDRAAEHELLDGSAVPVAIVGMKADLAGGADDGATEEERFARGGRDLFVVNTCAADIAGDRRFAAFLARAAEFVREGEFTPAHRRGGSKAGSGHVALSF